MTLIIHRVGTSNKGTFGVLCNRQVPFALTLERPWKNNDKSVSCIPHGAYTCQRVDSPKFGDTFEVEGVPGRSNILFHKGNTIDDTEGCILVGESFGGSYDLPMLMDSKHGFDELMSLLYGRTQFDLVIVPCPVVMEEGHES